MAGERNRARDAAIWDDYCNRWAQQDIAVRHGISQQRVSQIIESFRAALPADDKAEHVRRFLGQLDWITRELHTLASSPPIPAYSNGRPILVTDPDTGEERTAEDHSMRVTAMKEMRATQESARKILGTDAKVETAVTVETSPEMAALVEQARSRRAARDPGQGSDPQ